MSAEDHYLWLEDLSNIKTVEWITERNRKFQNFIEGVSSKLSHKVIKYFNVPYVTTASLGRDGIFAVVRGDKGYEVVIVGFDGSSETLLRAVDLGKDVMINEVYPSPEGGLVGVRYSLAGSDLGKIVIIDLNTRETVERFEGYISNVVWLSRDKIYYELFYRSGLTPDGVEAPAERVFLKEIGGKEEIVFGDGLGTNYMVNVVPDYDQNIAFVVIQYGWLKSKILSGPLNDPSKWRLVFDGGESMSRPVGHYSGWTYILHEGDRGLGRIVKARNGSHVEEVIAEGVFGLYPIEEAVMMSNYVVVNRVVNGSNALTVYDADGKLISNLEVGGVGSVTLLNKLNNRLIIKYESFNVPSSIYVLDGDLSLSKVLDFKLEGCELRVEDLWVSSYDGTQIHSFVVKRQGTSNQETRVALVYGYGGFNVSIKPRYFPEVLPLLEDGAIFVVTNLRGGGEYGKLWHKAGMRENKQNVFEDFKAVLKHFKKLGYKTVGMGRSNGGLLIAATLTQSPELLDVAVVGYPVIDMLRFHKLYIGKLWTTEYGNPEDPREREFLLEYSPYHNVRPDVKYPPTIVLTGLYDDRVHPAHAFKFVAKLEEVGAPVYLRTELKSGHLGSTPDVKIKEVLDILAFIYKSLEFLQLKASSL
ncbi:MAG: hypothetical protein B7O98_07635 [Zestosphaera tikiterensis]|uniref:prolyl oligopeptidase n=1 Tax=Zestosphaera tikiterensis TaxID=1973259 RepID=A0A2R7Y4S3_9CREN|nr:MAG: hypothetical protein B7O98_07635 [Zestosphaera tikiterensis]